MVGMRQSYFYWLILIYLMTFFLLSRGHWFGSVSNSRSMHLRTPPSVRVWARARRRTTHADGSSRLS